MTSGRDKTPMVPVPHYREVTARPLRADARADFRRMLAARAFQTVPGAGYNAALEDLLLQWRVVFEAVLAPDDSWETFRDRALPQMARYLHYKRIPPDRPHQAAVAVFDSEVCYVLAAEAFMDIYRAMDALSRDDLHRHVRQWVGE